MKLIFIHGREQEEKDPEKLEKLWTDSFKIGLELAGLSMPEGVEIAFPYYGDELKVLEGKEIQNDALVPRGVEMHDDNDLLRFQYEFFSEISADLNITADDLAPYLDETLTERGALNWQATHALAKVIELSGRAREYVLKRLTKDTFYYLTRPVMREAIDNIIKPYFDGNRCVVVGHSMGSIIGYNVLRALHGNFVNRFITVGSPLGTRSIKSHLIGPLEMPSCLKNGWYNAYDPSDIVSLRPLDEIHFPIEPAIENFSGVDNNTTKNRHGIVGYLTNPTVARVIHAQLLQP